jgi:hypothetical protein
MAYVYISHGVLGLFSVYTIFQRLAFSHLQVEGKYACFLETIRYH